MSGLVCLSALGKLLGAIAVEALEVERSSRCDPNNAITDSPTKIKSVRYFLLINCSLKQAFQETCGKGVAQTPNPWCKEMSQKLLQSNPEKSDVTQMRLS